MTANLHNIGAKIRQLREKSNLTQKQLADFLSVDQSLVSKFEKGERSIHSDALEQLATLFCCPISELMSESSVMPAYTIAFRTAGIDDTDLKALSVINKIALNQFKMDHMAGGEDND